MQFAAGAGTAKELVGLLVGALEDPDTYKRIEGLRTFLCGVTGKEIDQAGFITLLKGVTQGKPYTGQWEVLDPDAGGIDYIHAKRLRVEGGWIYDCGRGNPLFVRDK